MIDCSKCTKDWYCCGAYYVTLDAKEAAYYKYKRLEYLKENNKILGLVWVLTRDEEGFCNYYDKINHLCTIHQFKPKGCKDFTCQTK